MGKYRRIFRIDFIFLTHVIYNYPTNVRNAVIEW